MYEILGWPLSDPIVSETHGASPGRQTSRVVCVGLQFKVRSLRQTCPCMGRTPCFRSNWVFREVTPVGHSNLRLTGRITESSVGKRSHAGLTLLNVIDTSTKGFLEILSNVLVAQERSLSFTYGRPDESCSSFTLMYFGKRRATRIKEVASKGLWPIEPPVWANLFLTWHRDYLRPFISTAIIFLASWCIIISLLAFFFLKVVSSWPWNHYSFEELLHTCDRDSVLFSTSTASNS